MNKKILIPIIILVAVLTFAWVYTSNNTSEKTDSGKQKPHVAATIFPVYDITQNVAGDFADVELILAPGASPHTFDPSPSTLTKLQGVTRIFAIGQGIDSWSFGIVDNLSGSKIVELDRNITLRTSAEDHDEHEGEDTHENEDDEEHEEDKHGEFDPHYWLNPNNAIVMANTIADELAAIDPLHAENYRQNAEAFAGTLLAKEDIWQSTLGTLSTKDILTFHDGFFYFAEHFGLNVLTTFEPFPGKEPTLSYLQELEHKIEEYGINVLFTEPQLHGASLEQFAKDYDMEVFILDPLGGVDSHKSYIDLIDYNIQTIAEALK